MTEFKDLKKYKMTDQEFEDLKKNIERKQSELNKLQDEYRQQVGKNYVVPLRLLYHPY